jgi:hypothetical protein
MQHAVQGLTKCLLPELAPELDAHMAQRMRPALAPQLDAQVADQTQYHSQVLLLSIHLYILVQQIMLFILAEIFQNTTLMQTI